MKLPSLKELTDWYKNNNLTKISKWLPHLRHEKSPFIEFLMSSNILKIKEHIDDPPITLGADPEFILHEKGEIVLFSSQYTTDYFGISEAEIGADYGLLEFRPDFSENPEGLVRNVNNLHTLFKETYPDLEILEKEAIEYNHKRARVLEFLQKNKDINYGMNRGKDVGVWYQGDENIVVGIENGTSLSAYNKVIFNQFNPNLFTAGGHIHIGGGYILMLSINQLKSLVRKFDRTVLPICEKIETGAAKLRRTVYGTLGEFRIKNYGIEYRTPSNAIFWKKNSTVLLQVLNKIVEITKNMGK